MHCFFWFYLLFAQDAAFSRALEMQQAGDLAGAVSQYRTVIEGDPRRFDARSNLGAVLAKLGRYPEAIEQYEEALRSAPAEFAPRLRYNLALGYYKSFQIAKAEGELARLHEDNPGDWNAALLLADCELRLGQFQKVRELLLPLEAGRTGDLALTYLLGMALIRGGDPEGGQRRIDAILKAGDSAEARFLLASAMFMARDYPAAVKGFERAIALNPSLPELQAYYGQALLYTGDAAGASEAFQKELKQNPNNFEATLGLGQILEQRGQKAEAAGLLRRAAELRPGVTISAAGAGEAAAGGLAVGSMAPRFAALGSRESGAADGAGVWQL